MTQLHEILTAFNIALDSTVKKISGGKINSTWLIDEHDSHFILQRLHPMFRQGMIKDSAEILEQLQKDGWDVPLVQLTPSGSYFWSNNGIWRLSKFIESDNKLPTLSPDVLHACGKLLAELHISLNKIQLTLPAPIPHYRDTVFHINYLRSAMPKLTGDALALAEQTISAFEHQDTQTTLISPQLIHGDPKINNILFRDQLPYTYIDWDTVMTGSPFIDLGDFIRSLTKELPGKDTARLITAFCKGYHETSPLELGVFSEFQAAALNAAKLIALENIARYLYDIVDKSFWEWDTARYHSQEEAMLDQARKTLQIFETLSSQMIT
ncbi:MAG TPA: phosphotransferase [Candidatus Saccharimonadales bacterium]